MSKWRIPKGAVAASDTPCKHPSDKSSCDYYMLIRFTMTGLYALLGMAGEIRNCPQDWAELISD